MTSLQAVDVAPLPFGRELDHTRDERDPVEAGG
jgi:hypothetical protein